MSPCEIGEETKKEEIDGAGVVAVLKKKLDQEKKQIKEEETKVEEEAEATVKEAEKGNLLIPLFMIV